MVALATTRDAEVLFRISTALRFVAIAVVAAAWVHAGLDRWLRHADPGGDARSPKPGYRPCSSEQVKVFSAAASANGSYTLSNLPAGTYDVMVPPVGFSYARLQKKGIALKASQNLRLDLQVDWGAQPGHTR